MFAASDGAAPCTGARLMRRRNALASLTLLAALGACTNELPPRNAAPGDPTGGTAARVVPAASGADVKPGPALDTAPPAPIPPMPRPAAVRGLYVNRWAALGSRMWELIEVARRTEVNALVVDVKDDRGLVLYRSRVPLAHAIGADTVYPMSARRLRAVLDTMRAHGIYPIARIVVAKDPLLADRHREWAIRRRSDLEPWLDKNGNPWLDPHHDEVWDYAADLAREAVTLGFSEVQFDYVRFPDENRLVQGAVFPLARGRVRAQVIHDQLGRLRARVRPAGVPMTIDVFGLTATDTTDMGIGQRWELFVNQADYVAPMAYPSHYATGTYGLRSPNAHPYETVDRTLRDAARRSRPIAGAAHVVPWYQDFTLGPPHYGVAEVRAQIKAGEDNGIHEWMLWNPRSRYTVSALRVMDTSTVRDTASPAAGDSATPP